MKKDNLESFEFNFLKNSYRHFLSDTAPGFLLVLLLFSVLKIEFLDNSFQAKNVIIFFLITFLSVPLSLVINVSSYLFLNRLIRFAMLWSLKRECFLIRFCFFPGEFTNNEQFWDYFTKRNNVESLFNCLYSVSKTITLSGKIVLINRIGRIRGLEILCCSLSFLFFWISFAGQSLLFLFSSLCASAFLFFLSVCLRFFYFNDVFTYARLAYSYTRCTDWTLEFEESETDQKLAELNRAFCEYAKAE